MKWQTYLMVSWVAAITAAVSFYIGTSNAVSDVTPPFECFFVAVGSWGGRNEPVSSYSWRVDEARFVRHPNWDNLTDTQRTYWLLNNAGAAGVHSWELASWVPTRNASQRVKDVVSKGFPCFAVAERRNGRAGSRYFLGAANAPDHAVPVEPNFGSAAASGDAADRPDIGSEGEPVGRVVLFKDFTQPETEWELRAA